MWQRFLDRKTIWFWAAAVLLLAGQVMAAEQTKQTTQKEMEGMYEEKSREMTESAEKAQKEMTEKTTYLRSVSKMKGFEIKNVQGQTVGKVNEIILDDNQDIVHYVIVSAENKLYPVPWTAFQHGETGCAFDITAERLRQAPSIETIDVQQLSETDFCNKVKEFYSSQISAAREKGTIGRAAEWMKEKVQQAAKSEERPTLYKSADIKGLKVQDVKGEEFAKVTDIIVDARNGALAYGFVSFGGVMQIGGKTAAVPWSSLTIMPDRKTAMLDATTQTLEAAVVDPENLTRLSEPQFARAIHDNFGAEPYWEVFGFAPAVGMSMTPWQAGSTYNRRFDPAKITTIEGTIRSVGSYYPEKGAAAGISLRVESKQGELLTVYGGPKVYAMSQDITFRTGSAITVRGSSVTVEDKPVIMASELKVEGKTLRLYDAKGQPLWKLEKMTEKKDVEKPKTPSY